MPPSEWQPAPQRSADRWLSIVLSVLLHAALLGALVYGWLLYRRPPPPAPTLAVEARVVDARAVQGTPAPPQPATPPAPPPAPPSESSGPPEPTPEELAQREEQRHQAEEAAAAAQNAAEQKAQEEEAARQAEEARKAREAADAQKKAAEAQRQADAEAKAEREADLQRSLAAESQTHAARAGPALANWQAQIAARITRAWLRPPTAKPGIECTINVTQVPGGEVTQVTIGQCNGDQAVRESIEAAVYRASPLPPPPDPSLFDRNLKIDFKPD
jgi:colicin import membrane protein